MPHLLNIIIKDISDNFLLPFVLLINYLPHHLTSRDYYYIKSANGFICNGIYYWLTGN